MLLKKLHLVEPLTGLFKAEDGRIILAWGQHYSWMANGWEDMLGTSPSNERSGFAEFENLDKANAYIRQLTLAN